MGSLQKSGVTRSGTRKSKEGLEGCAKGTGGEDTALLLGKNRRQVET